MYKISDYTQLTRNKSPNDALIESIGQKTPNNASQGLLRSESRFIDVAT